MIEIDDKKKRSRMQKHRELKCIFKLQILYSYLLAFVAKVSRSLECNEILVIGVILYLIISIISIKKADEIKRS